MDVRMNVTMGNVIFPSSGGVAEIQRIFDGVAKTRRIKLL
jgi:hypothetical protein